MNSSQLMREKAAAVLPARHKGLGLPFVLLLLYPVLDYGRPPNPVGIPAIISVLLVLAWIATPAKKLNLQIVGFLLLLGVMSIGLVTAVNNYSAYQTLTAMAIILVCICIPLIHFIDSLRKIRIFVNVLVVVFLYVGVWAIFHDGNGPAGARGAQDENYTSAMMCIGLPLAYFSIPLTDRRWIKMFYIAALGVFATAVVVSDSRGGFVGMAGVALFCTLVSPRKKQALVAWVIGTLFVLMVAGPGYWEEMQTITDTKETTVDHRLELWAIAWRMFVDNALIGVGPGNFLWNVGDYQSVEQTEKLGRTLTMSVVVHSTYFEILSELGLVGSAIIATVLFRTFKDLRRIGSEERSRGDTGNADQRKTTWGDGRLSPADSQQLQYYSLAIMGSLVGFLIPAAFVSFTYFSHLWLLIALAAALNEVARETIRKVKDASSPTVAGV
jgi:O-antigen ligase